MEAEEEEEWGNPEDARREREKHERAREVERVTVEDQLRTYMLQGVAPEELETYVEAEKVKAEELHKEARRKYIQAQKDREWREMQQEWARYLATLMTPIASVSLDWWRRWPNVL